MTSDRKPDATTTPPHGLLFRVAARDLLYDRQNSTYHGLYYTRFKGDLAGTRYNSLGLPGGIDPLIHFTRSRHFTTELLLLPPNGVDAQLKHEQCKINLLQ